MMPNRWTASKNIDVQLVSGPLINGSAAAAGLIKPQFKQYARVRTEVRSKTYRCRHLIKPITASGFAFARLELLRQLWRIVSIAVAIRHRLAQSRAGSSFHIRRSVDAHV